MSTEVARLVSAVSDVELLLEHARQLQAAGEHEAAERVADEGLELARRVRRDERRFIARWRAGAAASARSGKSPPSARDRVNVVHAGRRAAVAAAILTNHPRRR